MNTWIILFSAYLADLAVRILFDPGAWSPDILLLSIGYITLTSPLGEAYFMAFLAGMLWDGTFLDFMGMHSFLFVLATMLIARFRSLLWAQYAISRLFIGFILAGMVRFGETIFWLSNMGYEIPVHIPQGYVLKGAIITGICFMLCPWPSRPIRLSTKSPQTVFASK